MEIIIKASPEEIASEGYEIVAGEVTRKPAFCLGLATGRTPVGLYRLMRESRLDFSRARFFGLDEFVGLGPDHPASFHRYFREHLLDPLGVPPEHVRFLRGDAPDLASECESYEQAIRSEGGIDLQILGVGRDGHMAFNTPGSSLGSRTRVKTLEESSLENYLKLFKSKDKAPRFALTMGLGTILETRRALILAFGREKADIVRRIVEGPVTAEVPGSVLQFHPRATLVLDEAAASLLVRRDYWKWVYQNKARVGS